MSGYWLFKTEPDVYGLEDLKKLGTDHWDGVRNYQARNFLRDTMKVGDQVLIYHSNTKPLGVAGLAEITRDGYPDPTQWDPNQKYADLSSPKDNPRWYVVDVTYRETFKNYVTRDELRENPAFADFALLRRGMRLSVMPIEQTHFELICQMGRG